MSPRTALILSVILGVIAVVLLQSEVRGGSVTVFRVTKDVGAGGSLRGAITPASIPRTSYDQIATTVPTAEFEQWILSTPNVRDVRSGETVTFDMFLLTAGDGFKVAAGQRAVGLGVSSGAQTAGFMALPGDVVDVLATLPEAEGSAARTILQAKKILAVDQIYRRDDSAFVRSRQYNTVTLEVTPAEAEMVEAYRTLVSNGFMLSLRNPGDTAAIRSTGFQISTPRQ